jgi:hypothetical protein
MACEDESLSLQARIERAADDADLEEVSHTARHLLSVACARAGSSAPDARRPAVGVPG